MSLLNNPNDYSGLSYEELRLANIKKITELLPGFTDASASGIILNTLTAIFDYTNFYHSIRGRESLLNTSEIYSNIIGLAENLNYVPKRKRSAIGSVTLKFTKSNKTLLESIRSEMQNITNISSSVSPATLLVFKVKPKSLKLSFQGFDFINPFEHVFFLDNAAISKIISDLEINESVLFEPQSFNTDLPISYIDVYQATQKFIDNINITSSVSSSEYTFTTFGNVFNNFGSFSEIIFNDLDICEYYAESDFGSKPSGLGVKSFDNNFTRLTYKDQNGNDIDITLSKDYVSYVNSDNSDVTNNVICGMKPNKKFYIKFGNNQTYITPLVSNSGVTSGINFKFSYFTTEGDAANNYAAVGQNMSKVQYVAQNSDFAYMIPDTFDSFIDSNINVSSRQTTLNLESLVNDMLDECEYVLKSNIIGGIDFETIQEIKQSAPASYSRRNRLVSKLDYKTFLESYDYPIKVNLAKVWGEMEEIINYNSQLNSQSGIFAKKTAHNAVFYSLLGYIYNEDGTKNDMDSITGQYRAYLLNKYEESLQILKNVILNYYVKDDINSIISQYNSTSVEIAPAVQLTETLEDIGIMGTKPLYIPSWRHNFDLIIQKNIGNNVTKIDESLVTREIYKYFSKSNNSNYNTYDIVSYLNKVFPQYGNFIRGARFKSSKNKKQWQNEIEAQLGNTFFTDKLFTSNINTNAAELKNYIDDLYLQVCNFITANSSLNNDVDTLKTTFIQLTDSSSGSSVFSGSLGTALTVFATIKKLFDNNSNFNSIYNIIYPSSGTIYTKSVDALYRTDYGILKSINTRSNPKISIEEEIYNEICKKYNAAYITLTDSSFVPGQLKFTHQIVKSYVDQITVDENAIKAAIIFSAVFNLLMHKHIGQSTSIKTFDISTDSIVNTISFNKNMTLRNIFKVLHDLAFACDFSLTKPTETELDRLTLIIPLDPSGFDYTVSLIKNEVKPIMSSSINIVDNIYVGILNEFEPKIKENVLLNTSANGSENMEYTALYSTLDGWSCEFEIPDITVKFI